MKLRNHETTESLKTSVFKTYILIILISFVSFSCNETTKKNEPGNNEPLNNKPQNKEQNIYCTNEFCKGVYTGPEFVEGSDIAHQHSNKMSSAVGDKLKLLFEKKMYSKVDFQNIEMTTEGMGSGLVTYDLKIPFLRVKDECESYTSFDHVGGWNHAPELNKRKKQLSKALLKDDKLNISKLKTTKEGLQEYWIQWRNKEKQKYCIK